jgi:hypothetical protein
MKKRSFCLFFFTMIFTIILLNYSYAYGFQSKNNEIKTFKVTLEDDVYKLNLTEYLENPLYPGGKLQAKFNIVNDTNKKIELKTINFDNLSITDMSTNIKIDSTNPRFINFTEQICLDFKHKESSIVNIPLSKVMSQNNFHLDKNLIFTSGSGSEFTIELSMNENAGNEVQNLRGDFNIVFNFTEYYVPPTPAEPTPTNTVPTTTTTTTTTTEPAPTPDIKPAPDSTPKLDPTPEVEAQSEASSNVDPNSASSTIPKLDVESNTKSNATINTIVIDEKLIQTGSIFDYAVLSILSVLLIGAGIILIYSKRK